MSTKTDELAPVSGEVPVDEVDEAEQETPLPRLVLGVRAPDSVRWRIHGPISPEGAIMTGASISCSTTFAARKAEVAEFDQPSLTANEQYGILGGPMPARDRSGPRARVDVEHAEPRVTTNSPVRPKK